MQDKMDDQAMFAIALEEAKKGFAVGGLPVCLLDVFTGRDDADVREISCRSAPVLFPRMGRYLGRDITSVFKKAV